MMTTGFCFLNACLRYYLWHYDAVFISGFPVGVDLAFHPHHSTSLLFQAI